MNKNAAHTNPWEIGETVFGAALLLGLALGYFFPLRLSTWVPRPALLVIGAALLLCGLALITITRGAFRQAGQPTDPGNPTTRLITSGVFALSRNPLYLGAVACFTGLALLLNSPWLLALLIPTVIAVQTMLILPEEQYLEAKFGDPYRQYARSVRRWLGRRRNPTSP
jgi:protein-S-isoprenylcysteine O-methyltransferase Ste14